MLGNVNRMSRKGTVIIHRECTVLKSGLKSMKAEKRSGKIFCSVSKMNIELFSLFGYEKTLDIDIYPDDQRWIETDLDLQNI